MKKQVLARFILAISLLGLLLGQVPRSVTVCLCTGEVGVTGVQDTDVCAKHASTTCTYCHPGAKRKGCFLTKSEGPSAANLQAVWIPQIVALPPMRLEIPERVWRSVIQPLPCLLLPRIREPDKSGHHLRAPPTLA